jgi:hypothetical protein
LTEEEEGHEEVLWPGKGAFNQLTRLLLITSLLCFARIHARKHTERETYFNASDNKEVDRRWTKARMEKGVRGHGEKSTKEIMRKTKSPYKTVRTSARDLSQSLLKISSALVHS